MSERPLEESEPLRIGSRVDAVDGECGELVRVIIDPVAQKVTHLVVASRHTPAQGHLVPIDLIDSADADAIRIQGTMESFQQLHFAQDIQFMPASTDGLSYGLATAPGGGQYSPVYQDRVPAGEVEVLRGDVVHAKDGWIGSVQGLVIDPSDYHVTHVLLQEGHLWGRKQVAIPIGATSRVEEEIRVELTKQEVEDLPPVDLRS